MFTVTNTGGTGATFSGAIGAANSLDTININATNTTAFSSTVDSDDIDFGAAGTVTFADTVTSANGLDFMNNAGTATFSDDADMTGTIASTGGTNGTVNFSGTSTVSGAVSGLAAINLNGAAEVVTFSSTSAATKLSIDNTATADFDGSFTGAIDFGADGTIDLAATKGVSGNIDNDSGGGTVGTLTVLSTGGTSTIGGTVGATNSLKQITLNGTGIAAFGNTVQADDIDFGGAGTVTFAGTVTSANGFDFQNNAAVATFADNANMAGTIDSTGGAAGTVNFSGSSTVSGAVGATNALTAINLNGTSETVTFSNTVATTKLSVDGAGTTADIDGAFTGAIDFGADGTVDLAATKGVSGAIDNDSGGDSVGTLTVLGTGGTSTLGGNVGATNSLKKVNINGTGIAAFNGTVQADDIDFGGAGTANFNGTVTSANGLDFMNNAGTATFADNANMAGTIDSTGGAAGTVNFTGSSTVSGAVGATNALTAINFNGNVETVAFSSTVAATSLDYTDTTAVTFANDVTGAIDFASNAGSATFADGADVTGTIDSTVGTGGTAVFNGTSTVSGAIGATNALTALTVGGAGALTVQGNVSADTITNGGTIAAGAGQVLTADTDFAGAGTYNITITDANGTLAAADMATLASAGAIDLSGETINFVIGANAGTGTVVFAAGGAAATAGGTVTDDSFIYTASLAANGSDIELTLAQNSSGLATTSNNSATGAVLDSLAGTTNTQLAQIQTQLASTTNAAELDEVLEAASSTVDGGGVAAGLSAVSQTTGVTNTRLAALRSGETGMVAGDMYEGLSLWAQAFGTTGEQDFRDGVDGYDIDTFGGAVGIDSSNVAEDTVVGLALSYANSDVDSKNATTTKTDIDTYQVSLYADHDLDDRTYVSGQVGYAFGNNDTTRHNVGGVSGLTAKGDYDSNQYFAHLEVGHDYQQNGGLTLTPSLSAHYVHYSSDDYTETGAGGANLMVDSKDVDILEFGLGVNAAWTVQNKDGSYMKPALHAGISHDVIGDRVEASNTFTGGGAAFTTKGFDPADTSFDVGADVTYFSTNNWELSAGYNFDYKSDYDAHSGVLKAQYKF